MMAALALLSQQRTDDTLRQVGVYGVWRLSQSQGPCCEKLMRRWSGDQVRKFT
jgi:hypothetical protein